MGKMQKAVAVLSPGRVEIVEIPMPTVHDYECLVKMRASGFCNSTDLKTIDNEIGDGKIPFPIILGHESVGEVVETASKVRNIRVGDVFLNPHGRLEPGVPYSRYWGGMMEYAIVQDRKVMDEMGVDKSHYFGFPRQIPGSIPFEDGGVILTLREIYSAVWNFGFQPGMEVLVYGDGPGGLGFVTFMKRAGAAWVGCVGRHDDRLKRIRDTGRADLTVNERTGDVAAAVGDRKLDLIIDAVGSVDIIRENSRRLKPGGRIGCYGVIKKQHSELSLVELRNNTVLHLLNYPNEKPTTHDEIVGMIERGEIHPKDFYSHVLPMEEIARAVELIRSREAFKVILKV